MINGSSERICSDLQQRHQNILSTVGGKVCPASFDSVLCWPETAVGNYAILPCFAEFQGVHYDATQNASRYCHLNGSWADYSDYDRCHLPDIVQLLVENTEHFSIGIELPTYIYCCGYLLSLLGLIAAITVLLSFKKLKCLRNVIHVNLFFTYILSALLWLLTLLLHVMTNQSSSLVCLGLVMAFHYFHLTNFFWMFVEGLYLYILVVQTFSMHELEYTHYALIGWGCPLLIVIIWLVAKLYTTPWSSEGSKELHLDCPWMLESHLDWIFQAPASLVLLLNTLFLIRIMCVLIRKLRSSNSHETRQYLKAAKALLVLIPLFGLTYLLVLTGPEHGLGHNLFEIIRATLISSQGLFVSLLFCFLNSEVRQTLQYWPQRWRQRRGLCSPSGRHRLMSASSDMQRRGTLSKDYTPRSRTESLRLMEPC